MSNAPDSIYAREISLFATNDGSLYAHVILPYLSNLSRKEARGTYDQFAAMKGWRNIADDATRRYSKEIAGYSKATLTICNPETRNMAATEIAESYEELLSEMSATERAKRNFKTDQAQLRKDFFACIAPSIPPHDLPMMREAFHNWKDGLQRDGTISEYLCDNATLPAKYA